MLVVVDVDGTLAIKNGRGPFEWDRASFDLPNYAVIEVVKALALAGHEVAFVSGREEKIRTLTEDWLRSYVQVPGPLFLRKTGDSRPDRIVKQEIFERELAARASRIVVLDDRDQVVSMWRSQPGVTCFQVADGNF